jgi:hypothetical protein
MMQRLAAMQEDVSTMVDEVEDNAEELEDLKEEKVEKNPIVTKVIEQAADMMGVSVGSTSKARVSDKTSNKNGNLSDDDDDLIDVFSGDEDLAAEQT